MTEDTIKDLQIVSTPKDLSETWVVYECYDKSKTPDPAYIGVSKLIDLFYLISARSNSAWRDIFISEPNTPILISIAFTAKTEVECINRRRQLVLQKSPRCNLHGRATQSKLICNETGQQFNTLREAAAFIGSTPSNLSNHVNQKPGFKSVKGFTFTRIEF